MVEMSVAVNQTIGIREREVAPALQRSVTKTNDQFTGREWKHSFKAQKNVNTICHWHAADILDFSSAHSLLVVV